MYEVYEAHFSFTRQMAANTKMRQLVDGCKHQSIGGGLAAPPPNYREASRLHLEHQVITEAIAAFPVSNETRTHRRQSRHSTY